MTLTDFFSNAFIVTLFSLLKELITFVLYRRRSETQVWLGSHSKGLGVKNRNSGSVSLSSKLSLACTAWRFKVFHLVLEGFLVMKITQSLQFFRKYRKEEWSKNIFLYACVYKYLPIFLLPRNHC